jgi:DNA topoisomerase-1
VDPATGAKVWLKTGRFGPYVEAAGEKPKRASLPKDWPPAAIDLEKALRLLRLPREVGKHPEGGAMILAGIGRYGPYVQHGGAYANLSSTDEVFDVGLNRAVAVLAEKAAGGARGGRAASQELRALGNHPATGKPVRLLAGRYGPYVKHEAVNANLPRGADPKDLTLEAAVALLAAREGAPSKRGGFRGATAKATGAKRAKPAKANTAKANAPKGKAKPAARRKAAS